MIEGREKKVKGLKNEESNARAKERVGIRTQPCKARHHSVKLDFLFYIREVAMCPVFTVSSCNTGSPNSEKGRHKKERYYTIKTFIHLGAKS